MATPVKRRAASVRSCRDTSRSRQVGIAAATEDQATAVFETVPLIHRLRDCPSPAGADDSIAKAGTTSCRLSSATTLRERRRCLSAEDPPHPPQTVTSRAPAVGEDATTRTSPRARCHSSNDQAEASSSAVNFLSPSTNSNTTVTPSSSAASSPARKARPLY